MLDTGTGVVAVGSAGISMRGSEIIGSRLAGLQLSRFGTVAGHGLAIRNNPIGVNIQDVPEGYDFFEAVDGFLMEGNQVNFDYSDLPVPDPAEIIETGG